jgi:hypothetical protein
MEGQMLNLTDSNVLWMMTDRRPVVPKYIEKGGKAQEQSVSQR